MKTIFIVDDNDINLFVGKIALEDTYKTYALLSAAEMFGLLERITPDLILLDVDMLEMSGFKAIEILKAKPETKDIPVIFLTSLTGETDRSKGLALGAVDYIFKPYNPALLNEKIEAVIGSNENVS